MAINKCLSKLNVGEPLFPGEDAADQLACIMEILGLPPMQMIKKGSQSHHYFNSSGQPLYMIEQHQHIYGNEQTDKLQEAITNLSKSLNSSSKLKRTNGNKHHKIRKSPGSTNLIEALTNSKNSSVCLPVGETSSFGHKIPQPLDPDMIDFLKGCLKWNPNERMNPVEALQHPWIRKMPSFTGSSIGRTNSFVTSFPSIMSDNSSKPVHSYRRYSYDQDNSKLSDLFDRSVKCTSNPKSPDRLKHPNSNNSLIEDEDIINNCNTPSITNMNDRMKIEDDSDCSDISISDVEQNCRNSGYYDNANSHNGSAKIILFNEGKVIRVPHITTGEHDI
ncbi:unnamed protein product [Trichobilharzia regenti]|nr:unnamed protein product [Trichobilharzia regenti]